MAEPKILTPANLVTQVTPFTANANELMAQAERAVIDSKETFATAVDFIKICQSQNTKANEMRTALVKPLNDHVKWINDQFRPITDRITAANNLMKGKAAKWQVAEDARIAAEAKEERERQEALALEEAAAAVERGDQETAEAILEVAIETPTGPTKAPTGRGQLTGASGGLRGTWKGEVANAKEICAAVGRGELPVEVIKEVSKAQLNKIANEIQTESTYHGIKIWEDKSLVVK